MQNLYIRYECNATFGLPYKSPLGQKKTVPYSIGAWTESGDVIDEALLLRTNWLSYNVEYQKATERCDEPCIYGGFIFKHYGHFLVESLSRMWAVIKSHKRIVWVTDPSFRGFTKYQKEILSLLDIDPSRHLFLDRPTCFAEIEIPVVGAVLPASFHPMLASELGVFPFTQPKPWRRIWLSRSKLNEMKAKAVNEDAFEAILIKNGWTILHPQEMSIKEQLTEVSDAEILAGFDGSAFHTVLLGSKVKSKLIIVPRGTTENISPLFQAISSAKAIDQYKLVISMEKVGGDRRGSLKSKILSIDHSISNLIELCNEVIR